MSNEKAIKSSNKMKIALMSLVFVFVLAIGAVVGVYAATFQGVNSQFNVKYEVGNNIAVKVTAAYQLEGSDQVSIGELEFNAGDKNDGTTYSSLSTEVTNVTLTTAVQSVRFIYTFENIGETGFEVLSSWDGLANNISLNNDDTIDKNPIAGISTTNNKNVFVGIELYNTIDDIPETFVNPVDGSISSNGFPTFEKGAGFISAIYTGEKKAIVITIKIADISSSAYCYSTETDGLKFSLNYTDK